MTAVQEGTAGEETSGSRTERVDIKTLLTVSAEIAGSMVETTGIATTMGEIARAVATATATAKDVPG